MEPVHSDNSTSIRHTLGSLGIHLTSRLAWAVVTLLGTATVAFLLLNLVPGDVAGVIAGPKASPEVLKEIRKVYHLDDPVGIRLFYYWAQLAHGDLGHSYLTDQSVADAIVSRFPVTLSMALLGAFFWMLMALPLGIASAKYSGTWLDRGVLILSSISLSLPAFWLARVLQYFGSFRLGLFPVAGFQTFQHLLLPSLTLAFLAVGYYARVIQVQMREALQSPYVRAARAKGNSETRILMLHALRNASIPLITLLGMDIAGLLGGVMFTENVFAIPGIGTLAVQSVFNLDVPMILGTVLFAALMVVGCNVTVDFMYRFLDPRIRHQSR